MRILIIDDDKELTKSLKRGLKSECFSVDTANDPEKGVYLACVNDYDLIILDNVMPKMDGKEVCENIRKKKKRVPILILSVKSRVADKVELLDAGADDYMEKPFSFKELIARVRAILRRVQSVESKSFEKGSLIIDTSKQIVRRGKKEIYFTRKEFMLLELLARNRNKIVSRGMILEHVWGLTANPFTNTIETHIGNIRRKLKMNKKERIIITVPGRGYKICLDEKGELVDISDLKKNHKDEK